MIAAQINFVDGSASVETELFRAPARSDTIELADGGRVLVHGTLHRRDGGIVVTCQRLKTEASDA